MKSKYDGKALTLKEQIQLLKERGLLIPDENAALACLSHIGFYRFFSYAKPLVDLHAQPTFERVFDLYVFDRKLRLLMIDAIETIEVAFRVAISEVMSIRHSPFWYSNPEHFINGSRHLDFMEKVTNLAKYKNHPQIKHYYNHYFYPEYPPSWMVIECLTFGTWSKVFRNLKNRSDKKEIAAQLGQPFKKLESWIMSLTDLRNSCAHHERLWNNKFPNPPKETPNQIHQNHRLYQLIFVIIELIKKIAPSSNWKILLLELLKNTQKFPITEMGFQENWQKDPIWHKHKNLVTAEIENETFANS